MKAIIVDDEQAARGLLKDILSRRDDVEVIDEASNGIEAIEKINHHRPDLLFLDVQMPVLSGFDILPYLEEKPLIIFCTAHEDYALRAFEVNALDYLLKPIEASRLKLCFEKLRAQGQRMEKLEELADSSLQKIVCRNQRSRHVVWTDEALAFQKEGRYTTVFVEDGSSHLTDLTVDYLHQKLPPQLFCRINRGVIIARSTVRSLKILSSGTGELICRNGATFSVSRARLGAFKDWLEQ